MEIYSIKRIDQKFEIIDQTLLPHEEKYLLIDEYQEMIEAIKKLRIRGAPAIGIAGAAAAYLAFQQYQHDPNFKQKMANALTEIENSRPTAVNLFHAIKTCRDAIQGVSKDALYSVSTIVDNLMHYELSACEKMAQNGFTHIPPNITRFLTHCNTGSLATYGIGTALGVIRKIASHREIEVFVDETRPLLQGSRLTMWELMKSNIKCTLITDNMAARTIEQKGIQAIITGADRIAQNGDTANKIGTFNLAILAKHFNIPFYIVAPETTIDRNIRTGQEMIIEERDINEITHLHEMPLAPKHAQAFNPAFDVTPHELITAIITDNGVSS
jgi:methylthioribose-1-phosphate isomerase